MLQSMVLKRVRHDWVAEKTELIYNIVLASVMLSHCGAGEDS